MTTLAILGHVNVLFARVRDYHVACFIAGGVVADVKRGAVYAREWLSETPATCGRARASLLIVYLERMGQNNVDCFSIFACGRKPSEPFT